MTTPPLIEPRLQRLQVVLRGMRFGVILAVVLLLPVALASDLRARQSWLGLLTGIGVFAGGPWLAAGLFFWARCHGNVRRIRDLRSGARDAKGAVAPLSVLAPVLVRVSAALLVLAVLSAVTYGLISS